MIEKAQKPLKDKILALEIKNHLRNRMMGGVLADNSDLRIKLGSKR